MRRTSFWPAPLDDPNHWRDSAPALDLPRAAVREVLLIASTERSGSSLLGSLLTSTGATGAPLEYFDEALMRAYERRTGTRVPCRELASGAWPVASREGRLGSTPPK